MNCHNGEKYLKEALNSLVNQSYKKWELIFYDNNSSDRSADIMRSYNDKRIIYIKTKFVNLGLARKRAFKHCKGDYITFLDCDDYWDKNKLKIQINEMIKNKDLGLSFTNSIFFKNNLKRKLYYSKPKDGYIFENLLRKCFISFDTVIISMKFIRKLKSDFDERFSIIHDLDLIIRLSKISRFKYIDRVLSYWRIHDNSFSNNKIKRINFEKRIFFNKLKKILKNDKDKIKLIELFEQNLKETEIEEYLYTKNVSKMIKILKKKNLRSMKNFLILILLIVPFGNKFYKIVKKS